MLNIPVTANPCKASTQAIDILYFEDRLFAATGQGACAPGACWRLPPELVENDYRTHQYSFNAPCASRGKFT